MPNHANSYDQNFKTNPPEKTVDINPNLVHFLSRKNRGSGAVGPIQLVGHTGYGDSMFDEKTPFQALDELAEIRAQRQPWIAKAGAGLGRAGFKALTEIAKMPGYAGGAIGTIWADEGQGWDTFVNNQWIKAIDNLSETVHEEALPVYVKKAVKEGNLWDNITAIDFWATEGADGVGFIAAMLAPGAALNALKFGSRVAGLAARTGFFADKMDDAAKIAGKLYLKPSNIDLFTQTAANTLFEAAAEANGAGQAYELRMQQKLDAGEITQEAFDLGKAEAMRNVFIANTAILAGPNAIMSKMLWGRKAAKQAGPGLLDDAAKPVAQATGRYAGLKAGAKDFGKAGLREGFFEEGMQSTAEEYFTEAASEGRSPDLLETMLDLPEAYLDMLGTVDGQKAIFLGAVLGGGMQVYAGVQQRKYDKKATHQALRSIEKMSDFFNIYKDDIYKEDGSIDGAKMADKLRGIGGMDFVASVYEKAEEAGNKELLDGLHNYAVGEMIKSFTFNPKLGLDALEEYLQKSPEVEAYAEERGIDPAKMTEGIMERAEKLQSDQKLFQEFSAPFINLKDNQRPEDLKSFYVQLNSDYLSMKNTEMHYQEKIAEYQDKLTKVKQSLNIEEEAGEDSFAVKDIEETIKMYQNDLASVRKDIKDFWKPDTHQQRFDIYSSARQAMDEKMANDEKADKAKKNIDDATTEEELDNVEMTGDKETDEYLKKQVAKKKESLAQTETADDVEGVRAQQELEEQQRIVDRDQADLQIEDLGNYIADNYNVGEAIDLSADQAPEFMTSNGVILEVNKENVVIEAMDLGMIYTIPRAEVRQQTPNPQKQFNTEGSENHDALIPQNNENDNKDAQVGGSKVISYDRVEGEVLPWVTDAYRNYELTPEDKTGKTVTFAINENPGKGKKVNQALKAYKNNDFSDMDLLIDYLPLNAVFAEGIEGSVETMPNGKQREQTFRNTTRPMRLEIINALKSGQKITDISTTIQGQNPGTLQVDDLDVNGNVKENSVLDLDFFSRIENKQERLKEIQKRIGYINEAGAFQSLGGDVIELQKPNAAGELYIMIPMANGKNFPLKLNISRIREADAEILTMLYKKRLSNKEFGKNARLEEVLTKEELANFKTNFRDVLQFIGKKPKDITIKDVTDFFVWDRNITGKARIGFTGDGKGKRKFVFGKTEVRTLEEFEKYEDEFMSWLTGFKRHQINLTQKATQENKATLDRNLKYLEYLLDNKIINTNAVVGAPTFAGFAEIFLDPTNATTEALPPPPTITEATEEKRANTSKLKALVKDKKLPTADVEQADLQQAPSVSIDDRIADVQRNKEFIVLDEKGEFYVNKKTGKKYTRVTKYIEPNREVGESDLVQSSLEIGNKIDELVRDFFAGELKPLDQYDVAETELLEEYIKYLEGVQKKMTERGENVLANDIVLYNDEIGVAGTVDLLTYDKEGNVRIYDMKTMRGNQFVDTHRSGDNPGQIKYEAPYKNGQLSNREKHQQQLSLYRILLNNTHGIKAKTLAIMPIEIFYEGGDTSTSVLNPLPGVQHSALDKVRDAVLSDKASLEKLEKSPKKIRKTKKNFVSSHEVENSPQKKKVEENKEKKIAKDTIEVSAQVLTKVAQALVSRKLIKIDANFHKSMKGSNKQKFLYLERVAKKHDINIEEIIKECKG